MKVALEAIKGQKTTAEITAKYGVHVTQINTWKRQALEIMPEAFSSKKKRSDAEQHNLVDELYKQIGQLSVERDWLKKNVALSP
jgi:transposase